MYPYRKRFINWRMKEETIFDQRRVKDAEVGEMLNRLNKISKRIQYMSVYTRNSINYEINCFSLPELAGQWNELQYEIETEDDHSWCRVDQNGDLSMCTSLYEKEGERKHDFGVKIQTKLAYPARKREDDSPDDYDWLTKTAWQTNVFIENITRIRIELRRLPESQRDYTIWFIRSDIEKGWTVHIEVNRKLRDCFDRGYEKDDYEIEYIDESLPEEVKNGLH
jgi:hypothetical protein